MSDEEANYDEGGFDGYDEGGYDGYDEGGQGITDVEHEGYFGRLGDSFAGICIGLVLFIGAFPLLWWNEGRAVDMYRAVNEGRNIYVPINATSIDSANEGKLVYVTGFAEATQNVSDTDFGVDANSGAIRLLRDVEMYQWTEHKKTEKQKNAGGSVTTVTKYTYHKEWRSNLVDTSKFRDKNYPSAPSMPYVTEDFTSDVILGSFSLPDDLVTSMSVYETLEKSFSTDMIPADNLLAQTMKARVDGNGFYFSTNVNATASSAASIGDTKVRYMEAAGGDVSILAKQFGNTFEPYKASSGASLYRLDVGIVSAEQMFDNAEAENKILTWILRIVGMIVMSVGIGMMLQPLSVAADIIPCIGDCVGGAISCVASLIGIVLSLLVIGIAWVAQRPVVLGVAGGGIVLVGILVYCGVQRKKTKAVVY